MSIDASQAPPSAPADEGADSVWTFRGYKMRPGEFNTAMVHFYRGEISRSNTWRQRLDTTTNWAVIATGAALSFSFSDPNHHHGVILLNTLLVALFLYIEARRYRYYELWSYRVRLMETDFFAAMLHPPFKPTDDWAESLATTLLHPEFPVGMLEAIGRRFRRNYFPIFLILASSWLLKGAIHPNPVSSWEEFIERSSVGPFPGTWVLVFGLVFNVLLFSLGLFTIGLQHSSGEVLPRVQFSLGETWRSLRGVGAEVLPRPDIQLHLPRRHRQHLTFIISPESDAIAERVMRQLKRGVTALHGTGMYTGQPRNVLMCAVRPTQVNQLKEIVYDIDPNAFLMINQVQELWGRGFDPLKVKRPAAGQARAG